MATFVVPGPAYYQRLWDLAMLQSMRMLSCIRSQRLLLLAHGISPFEACRAVSCAFSIYAFYTNRILTNAQH